MAFVHVKCPSHILVIIEISNFLLGWCKSNCDFCIVEIFHLMLEYILNKYGYIIHHFNVHISPSIFC